MFETQGNTSDEVWDKTVGNYLMAWGRDQRRLVQVESHEPEELAPHLKRVVCEVIVGENEGKRLRAMVDAGMNVKVFEDIDEAMKEYEAGLKEDERVEQCQEGSGPCPGKPHKCDSETEKQGT